MHRLLTQPAPLESSASYILLSRARTPTSPLQQQPDQVKMSETQQPSRAGSRLLRLPAGKHK